MMPQNSSQQKKQAFFEEKLSKAIGKPNELRDLLSLGMPNKTLISNFNPIEDTKTLTHDTSSIFKNFKNLFLNLAESLLLKLPKQP